MECPEGDFARGYDRLVHGESGVLSVNGTPEGAARVGISVCDIAAGETACAAVLQALIARDRTGKGRTIEVSLFHTMAEWMNVRYLQTRYGGTAPPRLGLRHPSTAPYGAFRCADGRPCVTACLAGPPWHRMNASPPTSPALPGWPRSRR